MMITRRSVIDTIRWLFEIRRKKPMAVNDKENQLEAQASSNGSTSGTSSENADAKAS
jgi:hypothetical protein